MVDQFGRAPIPTDGCRKATYIYRGVMVVVWLRKDRRVSRSINHVTYVTPICVKVRWSLESRVNVMWSILYFLSLLWGINISEATTPTHPWVANVIPLLFTVNLHTSIIWQEFYGWVGYVASFIPPSCKQFCHALTVKLLPLVVLQSSWWFLNHRLSSQHPWNGHINRKGLTRNHPLVWCLCLPWMKQHYGVYE
jgi:hypothetical protein